MWGIQGLSPRPWLTFKSRMRRKSAPVPVGSSVRKFSISVSGRLPMTCAGARGV